MRLLAIFLLAFLPGCAIRVEVVHTVPQLDELKDALRAMMPSVQSVTTQPATQPSLPWPFDIAFPGE